MSFEVIYNGDIQYIKVFYSTEKTRAGKYYGEFYKKMDELASDLKRLKQELDEDSTRELRLLKMQLIRHLPNDLVHFGILLMNVIGMKIWSSVRFLMTEKRKC